MEKHGGIIETEVRSSTAVSSRAKGGPRCCLKIGDKHGRGRSGQSKSKSGNRQERGGKRRRLCLRIAKSAG